MIGELDAAGVEGIARAARGAARVVGGLPSAVKNQVLAGLAQDLRGRREEVLAANAQDLAAAADAGQSGPKLQRLGLTSAGIDRLAAGLEQVAALPDPVGAVTADRTVASGLRVRKVRTPLGVIAMIYEARPGVTLDAFALCFKAGNACILKGGREAAQTNRVLLVLAHGALAASGAPREAVSLLDTSDRGLIGHLLRLTEHIDLAIPRGGVELIRFVHENARVPTLLHFQGVCHVYVDRAADLEMAERICLLGKTSAPATCNATECVLVHQDVAAAFVPRLVRALSGAGVEVRGDGRVRALSPGVAQAQENDFGCEFLDLIVAMRVVDSLDDAVRHIDQYGSDHTEAIVTGDLGAAEAFTTRVRSSCVLVNASTRFNDGFELGLGAEIGISTSRLHAYGPMGLEELTTQRYVVHGSGQAR